MMLGNGGLPKFRGYFLEVLLRIVACGVHFTVPLFRKKKQSHD